MKITLFGCKDTTLHLSNFLKELDVKIDLITITPETAKTNEVAGYLDLTSHKELFQSIYQVSSYSLKDKSDVDFLRAKNINSLGLCVGWQRLIPNLVLDLFTAGVFGMHGSARDLPFGKGRSPINWAILEDRKFFHTNLFKYLAGVDSGPIVSSHTFSILKFDNAETLHYKNTMAMCHLVQKNLNKLLDGSIKLRPQNTIKGESFYPKRLPNDGQIDWKDDIFNIDRLVRAVSQPFYGAFTFENSKLLKILRANIFYTDVEQHPYLTAQFGEVVDIFSSNKFLVRCSGGILIVHDYEGSIPQKGIIFNNQESTLSRFTRNDYGFFDI